MRHSSMRNESETSRRSTMSRPKAALVLARQSKLCDYGASSQIAFCFPACLSVCQTINARSLASLPACLLASRRNAAIYHVQRKGSANDSVHTGCQLSCHWQLISGAISSEVDEHLGQCVHAQLQDCHMRISLRRNSSSSRLLPGKVSNYSPPGETA